MPADSSSPTPPLTQRYKLTIAYRGTAYYGWQHQEPSNTWKGPVPPKGRGLPTVQEHVKHALTHVVKHPVTVVGSSRTDSGVHAKGQVAHFDTDKRQILPENLRLATNYQLPGDILIRKIEPVPDSFNAIGSTVAKRYQYSIWNAIDRPPFASDLNWHRWQPLDIDAMRVAAAQLVGTHDFASFAKPGHKRISTVRTIYDCEVSCRWPRIVIGISGNGFLWQMVRIIVGTLAQVGKGLYRPEQISEMLAAKDRRAAGSTAPPEGLFLQWVRTGQEEEKGNHRVKERAEVGGEDISEAE